MAKKKAATKGKAVKKVNKSAAIKDYLAAHPDARPIEISDALKKKGVSVTPIYVSNIKSTSAKAKLAKGKGKGKRKSKDTSPAEDVVQAGQLMLQAVELVTKAGTKEAKAMVELASKMVERITDEKK